MKGLRLLYRILKKTHTDRMLISYVIFVLVCAFLVFLTEPSITNYGDALWYCYAVLFTVGFGDVTASLLLPRMISLLVSIYSTIIIAILTGVIVNYINTRIEEENRNTLSSFLDKLEQLPTLSHEELVELSKQVSAYRNRR